MPLARFEKLETERRQRLIEAAAQEFATNGYEGASLARIGSAAGMSKPALYYYFEDKADLFAAIVAEAWRVLSPVTQIDPKALDASSFWPAIARIAEANVELFRNEPWLVAVFKLAYQPPGDARVAGTLAKLLVEAHGFVEGLLARGRELGVVRDDLPQELLVALVMGADRAADQWMAEHWDALSPEEQRRLPLALFATLRRIVEPAEPRS